MPLPDGGRSALPEFVPPELATLTSKPPEGDEWLHELKFDGYRILARLADGRARLISRNARDWTDQFPGVARAIERLPARQALVDGEVAMFLPDGTTSFQALQNAGSADGKGQLAYVAFDLLHLDGHDLTPAPLEERKDVLERLIAAAGRRADPVRYSSHVIGSGREFFERACGMQIEGVVSKRRRSPYKSARTMDWLKIKCMREQEIVIGGYTDPEGTRLGLGALLAGVYEDGRLVFAGKVGTGFTERTLRDLHRRLKALEQPTCPFTPPPTGLGRPHWVRPALVAQVTFGEWTSDGKMRHPSYQGLREDKSPTEVVRERPVPPDNPRADAPARGPAAARSPGRARREVMATPSPAATKSAIDPPRRLERPAAKAARAAASAAIAAPRSRSAESSGAQAVVAGVRLTHADRVVYPALGLTKRDVARYYESVASFILPHVKDRPTTLVRCPQGVQEGCFYQKHTGYWAPESVRRVKIREKTKIGEYLVADDVSGLVGLVQIGILEIHTWNSVVARLERPDRVVFDLDPGPGVPWPRVIEAARLLRERLLAVELESFVKTTGGKGLHVVVPLSSGTTWEAGAAFSRELAEAVAREEPRRYVATMAKSERGGKIFIDYLRNVRGATSIAAYSTRARPNAPVSVPIAWDELSPRLRSDHYTAVTLPRRLAGLREDPWARYGTVRQDLP